MIVSHNELVSCVSKAFLGMRRSCGEADVIAGMVADLQMVGLEGVRHFNKASPFLGVDKDCAVSISYVSKQNIVVDLHHGSVACHLPAILDYAVEKLSESASLTIDLQQCHNRWLGYSELVRLAAKGIACRAQWINGSSPQKTLYVLNRGCVAPEVFFSEQLKSSDVDFYSMSIELSLSDFYLNESSKDYSIHTLSKDLLGAQRRAWREGIEVDDLQWQILKKAAEIFLVENSEKSMQGAGGVV